MSCWQSTIIDWTLYTLTIWCWVILPPGCTVKDTMCCHAKCLCLRWQLRCSSSIAAHNSHRLMLTGVEKKNEKEQQEQNPPLECCENRGYYLPSILSANGLKQDQYLISTCCIYFINRYFMGLILYWDWISGLNRQEYFLPWHTDLLASCTDLITGWRQSKLNYFLSERPTIEDTEYFWNRDLLFCHQKACKIWKERESEAYITAIIEGFSEWLITSQAYLPDKLKPCASEAPAPLPSAGATS